MKSEINIWKSKYTESIKFKIFSDVLTSIFLKTKSSAYAALAKYHNYTKKIETLNNIIELCQGLKLKDAFYKIKFDGQMKLLRRSDNLYESIRKANLQEAFDALNYNRKIYRLNNIAKIINKYMNFIAFSKINRKKERVIKAKLSINLLETMIKQHTADNIKKVINKFNKNRLKRLGAERLFRYTSTKYESYAKYLI